MPLFEYKCETCEKIQELFMKYKDELSGLYYCPTCDKETKQFKQAASNIKFTSKGEGFYNKGMA